MKYKKYSSLKILSVISIGILVLGGFSTFALSTNKVTFVKKDTIECSEPKLTEEAGYHSIKLAEADTYLTNPGQPVLPVIIKTYIFPIGTTISDVICQPKDIRERHMSGYVGYASDLVSRYSTDNKLQMITPDADIHSSQNLYPNQWFDYNFGVGLKDSEHVTSVTIQFYPVHYSTVDNLLYFAKNADIEIHYETSIEPVVFPDKYDLVIITPLEFSSKLKRLVMHKENMGVKTKLVTTQEIYRNYEERDKQEKIKHFIQHAVEEWGVSYVLLFGGMRGQRFWSWYVPVRYSHLDDASNLEKTYISDLYYADIYKYDNTRGYIFDDWDSNGNGIFAEWDTNNKDVLDLYPDVYVGRLPCQYNFEVKRLVDRIINYETKTYGQEWFKKMAVIGGDCLDDISWSTSTDYIEGQVTTELALSYMDGFEHIRVWAEGGDIDLTKDNIINILNEGQGFVYFSGHGSPISWGVHPHADFKKWVVFRLKDIRKLDNRYRLPVLIAGGCSNCRFDVSILNFFNIKAFKNGEVTPKCWSWLFASFSRGGSIATIGNTGFGYGTGGDGPDPPDQIPGSIPDGIPDCIQYLDGWIETHFFEVYNHYNQEILGNAYGQTITDYLNKFPIDWDMNWNDHEYSATILDCKTVQQWVLLGDPSLKIGGYE